MPPETSLRRPAAVALAIYGVVLAVVGFFPTPVDRDASPWIRAFVAAVRDHGGPWWFDYGLIEFTANIALFVPFGVLAAFAAGPRRVWLAVLAGASVSVLIEVVQWLVLPERFPSVLDVVANTIGTAIGAAIAFGVQAVRGSQ
jgi:VanZ like family